ncbi:MAG TPA: LLM class flavin-dependent oxidoreductase [Aigarchaeota archaeon]|nr:LLM class flavin-dependent oxidoreductase [Aigarchaeota archaeon]
MGWLRVEIGVVIPNMPPYCDASLLREVAEIIDASQVGYLFIWDHYSLPWSDETLDAWVALSYLASLTGRVKLGTCVSPVPFRHPAALAKVVASLDVLSGGRAVLGVGAGWHKPEFTGFAYWYGDGERVSRTIEGVRIIKELWRSGRLNFRGRYYTVQDAVVLPRPVQDTGPKILFGTTGDRMLRAAARLGDGWIPTMTPPRVYASIREKLLNLIRLNNRDAEGFIFAYADFDIHDNTDDYIKVIEKHSNVGCRLYAATWRYGKEEAIKKLKDFIRDVVPSFS